MSATPNLSLPYLAAGQSQKHVTHNEALRALDALAQIAVLDRNLTAPPPSPVDGARYIVASPATGSFAGHAGSIAAWQDGAWMFYPPRAGWLVWVEDEQLLVVHDGTTWQPFQDSANVNPVAMVGIATTADTTNRLAVASPAALFANPAGSHQLKVSKAAPADTASLVFQTSYAARAEIGTIGDDAFRIKVTSDGTTWRDALFVDPSSGAVTFPSTLLANGENLLINGAHLINQRNFSGGALAAGAYGHDRWKAGASGANYTLAAGLLTLASGELLQIVEPAFWGAANFAQQVMTVSVEAPTADLTITLGGLEATITAGTGWRSATMTVPSTVTGNLTFAIRRLGSGSVAFRRIKLERGATPTAWRDRANERDLAERFYRLSQCVVGNNSLTGTTYAYLTYPTMRGIPAVIRTGNFISSSEANTQVSTVTTSTTALFIAGGVCGGRFTLDAEI
ncbi:MAG TPA: DUF2793 domain-containing protein [Hyphomicrobiaceae bacterium]|nr:DUF2793 domain-containing protein [Hyphomicrobiaceae bacterium]